MTIPTILTSPRQSRWLLWAACVALGMALITGGRMWSLFTQELLWGYLPLGFLLSSWSFIVLIRAYRRARKRAEYDLRPFYWSTVTGVLLGIGFPDILPLPWLLLFAWLPLMRYFDHWAATPAPRKRELLGYAFHALLLWNIIATYWVTNTSFFAGLFATIANSLLMCIPWLLFLLTRKHLPQLGWASLVAYWLSFEYLHLQWELTWPWLTLGNGWAEYPSLVQWYEYTGVFGGGLWIWVMNILLYQAWKTAAYQPVTSWWSSPAKPQLIKALALLSLPMLVSVVMYSSYQASGDTIDVVLVQPNFEPHYEKFERIPESEQIDRFIALSQSQLDAQVDYLVFPETSFGFVEETNIWRNTSARRLREAFGEYTNLKLVTGLNAYHDFLPNEPRTPATRVRNRNGQDIEFETMNLAAQLPMKRTDTVQTYRKSKLVPGPESFPFKNLLFFMEPVVNQLGGTTAGLGTQASRTALVSDQARIAPVICYESVFGGYFTNYVRQAGAQAAFIMTNDGWWDNTAGHRQHLYFASLRAIETRRDIGRSANTGISGFINQRGDIRQTTHYDEPIAIRGTMTLNDEVTFYVLYRDLIARAALFLSILLLLNAFVKAKLPKKA